MESLSRSSHRRKHSTAAAANVFSSSFSFKNPYADVLLSTGGDRKSLQVHEYSEIFSGSSSIPVLDLSGMDERVGSGDSRSSKLDYTNIFSGLSHDDVFVPYEELINGSAKRAKPRVPAEGRPYMQESGSRHCSRKAEIPLGMEPDQFVDRVKLQESGSLPSTVKIEKPSGVASDLSLDGEKLQESGSLHPSRKKERPSAVASDQSIDGIEQQFNLSFNRTNQINTDALEVKTHIAELHAVPGFTQFVDGSRPSKGNIDRPPLIKREVSRTWSFSTEVKPVNAKGGPSFEKSQALDKSHNVSEFNPKSPLPNPNAPMPSSFPTNLSDNKETRHSRATKSAFKGDVSQKVGGESSEDLDDNSVDAVSAAALKKAIEQAQESIRIAKIIMERKREGNPDGAKNNSTRKNYEESAGIDEKSTSSISQSDSSFCAESSKCERVLENVQADREPVKTADIDANIKVEKLEKNGEADVVQREGKYFPGCKAVDLEPVKAGNFRSIVAPMSELASNLGRLVTGTETFKWRDFKANLTKKSEAVPQLVEEALQTSQRTQGMEKSWEEDELSQDTSVHAEGPQENGGRVLGSSQRIPEHEAVDLASENLRIFPEAGVNEQRENDRDDIKQHEKKLEECDELTDARSESNDMLNVSCNQIRNESLDQQEMDRKTEGISDWEADDQRHAKTYNEEISETRQKEDHLFFDNKEQLKEAFLEVIGKGKSDVFSEAGEFKINVDDAHQPQIDYDKQYFADNLEDPKLTAELVMAQVKEEHVNARTNIMEASHYTNVQKRKTFRDAEKTGNTKSGEDQEARFEEDINEAVNLSNREASIIFDVAHTNGASNIVAETQESCHVESNSKVEDHNPIKKSERDVAKSIEAVSALDEDKMEEKSFSLPVDGMRRTNFLHRSASEEIFVVNELPDAYGSFSYERRMEAVDVMDANPKENLSQGEYVSKTTRDIHDAAQEYDAEINKQDIPQVLESHFRKVELDFPDVEQVLEQTAESDEGSKSDSSIEKIDNSSSQKSDECIENVKGTPSNEEELINDMIFDERKCAAESSEVLYSQLHDEPQEMDKNLETEEGVVDTDVNVDKDQENLVDTLSSREERDAKESTQNFESNDQQQRIEAIKRGREREKDRVAVERAIREARERAFAEVRERAERAAVERAATEVRQRVKAEARQKVEKPPMAKQPLDKASTEAKVRAERAAVERATAEARERALEKAKSLKTSEELKTPADKHPTERFSSSSRNSVLKHSFSSSDLETGMDTESAQRRKARLERHQRIMERAEKALAEKNMRDLLAQKEQAERNRLAESLDADIKRWASGKEGNLRALLSTLQYILGPESGWQSISLTEIITTAAVKKAYRKATLCVHPDKLQQRGASVQQKYICEKVFDLLKAAWNRFNSDER